MNVTGRPAQFGRGVIAEVGGKLVEKFAENLAQMISDGGVGPDGAAAPAGAAVAEAGAAGAAVAEAGAADAGTADATSSSAGTSSAEGAGDGSAVNGSAVATDAGPGPTESAATAPPPVRTATLPPAAQKEDSINLVRLVGPAVLKRVLPVAAGIVALALLGRHLRHLLRHRGGGKKA
jgi:hypothetical protein